MTDDPMSGANATSWLWVGFRSHRPEATLIPKHPRGPLFLDQPERHPQQTQTNENAADDLRGVRQSPTRRLLVVEG